MRNSPIRMPWSRGAIYRSPTPAYELPKSGEGGSEYSEDLLAYLVFLFDVRRRCRQHRIERVSWRLRAVASPAERVEEDVSIEIGEVPEDFFAPVLKPLPQPTGRTEDGRRRLQRPRKQLYTASWNVLGQYVARILDRRVRHLQAYLEAKAFERLAQAEQRAAADAVTRKWLPKTERRKRRRLRVMKRAAYFNQVHLELKRELDALVQSAQWLDTFTRDPDNTFCMATAKNHKRVFLLVCLEKDGVGGKIVSVYDTPRFNRMTRQNGRRDYRRRSPSHH